MKKYSLLILLSILVCGVLILPEKTTHAQQKNSIGPIIIAIPSNPEPGDQVTLKIESYSIDLNKTAITWFVNGEQMKSGVGLKSYNLIAGEAGKKTRIVAQISTQDGKAVEVTNDIIPAGIDLLYESMTYTPPFYKGKALNVNQADNVIIAFPEIFDETGRKLTTNELIFTWKKDGVVIGDYSGRGKNSVTISGTIPSRDTRVSVVATSATTNISAEKEIIIPRHSPTILFYEKNPLYGLMTNRAVRDTINLQDAEFSFFATPFFFSVGYPTSPSLSYKWSINNSTEDSQAVKNIFTVKQNLPGSGNADISLKIFSQERIMQQTNINSKIYFNKE